MSTESDLFDALKPLVGNRVAPVVFPQPDGNPPTWPAIRYTFVDSVPVTDICGDGDDSTAETRIQLDIVAKTYVAARALRLEVMEVMRSFNPPAILASSGGSLYDEPTRTYREILDYTLHGSTEGSSP